VGQDVHKVCFEVEDACGVDTIYPTKMTRERESRRREEMIRMTASTAFMMAVLQAIQNSVDLQVRQCVYGMLIARSEKYIPDIVRTIDTMRE
jgi:hypothetical protein